MGITELIQEIEVIRSLAWGLYGVFREDICLSSLHSTNYKKAEDHVKDF